MMGGGGKRGAGRDVHFLKPNQELRKKVRALKFSLQLHLWRTIWNFGGTAFSCRIFLLFLAEFDNFESFPNNFFSLFPSCMHLILLLIVKRIRVQRKDDSLTL